MIEYNTILIFSFSPEIICLAGAPFKEFRAWFAKMIEDSDGDPHHVDGMFIILLFGALWCFHVGIIAGLQCIYLNKDLNNVAITFLSAAAGLLGIRLALKPKIPIVNQNETKI